MWRRPVCRGRRCRTGPTTRLQLSGPAWKPALKPPTCSKPWPVTDPRSRTPRPENSPWYARPTSTSTRAWQACTGPGTATCAPTASPRCSAALSRMAASTMTRCGSAPAASRPGRASRPLWRCPGAASTSPRSRYVICGSTAPAGPPAGTATDWPGRARTDAARLSGYLLVSRRGVAMVRPSQDAVALAHRMGHAG